MENLGLLGKYENRLSLKGRLGVGSRAASYHIERFLGLAMFDGG